MAANDSLEPLDRPDVVCGRLYTSRHGGERFHALLDTAEKLAGRAAAPATP